jgi:hypothetical protein
MRVWKNQHRIGNDTRKIVEDIKDEIKSLKVAIEILRKIK